MTTIHYQKPIHVHFIGIGGISMSGLAEILIKEGFPVSGSDAHESALTDKLAKQGATISYPQKAENITDDIDLVVYSAAIHEDNPEYAAAKAAGLPMIPRAALLGQVMKEYDYSIAVSGTHGKTTTTSMLSHILLEEKADPTISVGGMLKAIDGNIRVGGSHIFLAEACEYTNSFLHLYPKYSLILNIEADHLDFFKDLDDIRHSFRRFASQTAPDGCVIINGDIQDYKEIVADTKASVLTFGMDSGCDYYPKDITFNDKACCSFTAMKRGQELGRFQLAVPGIHNVANALAAIALSDDLHFSMETVETALASFSGTDRRFEYKGTKNGVTVIDDYAHHPSEISATLAAAKKYPHKRLVVIFQPHTYTRTKALLPDFGKALAAADLVILAKIFPARETDTLGISSDDVRKEVEKNGTKAYYFDTFEGVENFVKKNSCPGDLLITMGAGNVVSIGEALLKG